MANAAFPVRNDKGHKSALKRIKNIIRVVVWTVVAVWAAVVIVLHVPAVQRRIANGVASALGSKLATDVRVGRVDVGWLDRIVIDDISVDDRDGNEMLTVARAAVKIDVWGLMDGRVDVSSAQLFGVNGTFYKTDSVTAANYQFVLDAFSSNDTTHKSTDVHVNSVVIRRANMRYDRRDVAPTPGKFNVNHLEIKDLSTHIIMPYLTDDSVHVMLKRLSVKETSGLDIRDMAFSFKADKSRAELSGFSLVMNGTDIRIDSLAATYNYKGKNIDKTSIRYVGKLAASTVTPADISFLDNRLASMTRPVSLSADIAGTGTSIAVSNLRVDGSGNSLSIVADMALKTVESEDNDTVKRLAWLADIDKLYVNGEGIDVISDCLKAWNIQLPSFVGRLGYLSMTATGSGNGSNGSAEATVGTGIGDVDISAKASGETVTAAVTAANVDLGAIAGSRQLGAITATADINGHRLGGQIDRVAAKIDVDAFEYNGYRYSDINVDADYNGSLLTANIAVDDPNGSVEMYAEAAVSRRNGAYELSGMTLSGAVNDFCPAGMRLTDRWGDAMFSANIDADITGKDINDMSGYAQISDFTMMAGRAKRDTVSADDDIQQIRGCALRSLRIETTAANRDHELTMTSDFGDATVKGTFSYTTLAASVMSIISGKLPVFIGTYGQASHGNSLTANIRLTDASFISALFGFPLTLQEPLYADVEIDDNNNILNVRARGDNFTYDNTTYNNAVVDIANGTAGDTLAVRVFVKRVTDDGKAMDLDLRAAALGDVVDSNISWDNHEEHPVKGTLNSSTTFSRDVQGNIGIDMAIHNSEILVNDTVWTVQPSRAFYANKTLDVDSFAIAHGDQYIRVTGRATASAADSLTADLRDVDIGYILDLVNFHKVEFDGKATGTAYVKKVFSRAPEAYANLTINDFLFQGGRMGTMDAAVRWNNDGKQIEVDAVCNDGPLSQMPIHGYVSIGRHYIDLNFLPRGTSLEFLLGFCGSFIGDIDATATGDVTLSGDLSEINLTGTAIADGQMTISSLNTTYHLNNDTIVFIPNEILFDNAIFHDDYGNRGIVNGALHHKHLTKLTYDLSIEAENLLAYDFKDYGGESFYGTVFATGTCDIIGRIGSIDFNINATAGPGSFIEYDAASESTITEQEFITWRDKQELINMRRTPPPAAKRDAAGRPERPAPDLRDMASDMHLNFLVNTTPDFTLRVLMDKQSGDCISLNGSGTISATYYNKGSFEMFGNYAVESGTYKLTIQNLMTREFIFDDGSLIVFGGDPYNATLNLRAVYTLNSVPLSDLRIGNSFAGNNVRVDCIMNIVGTPLAPRVEFDLDLPTISSDAQQMVRSLINSEEEMNQQVIYLLSIGRFYAESSGGDDETSTSQTSLAMQSILSGTVSQQINNLLSSFVNISNWNVGANISTGDEGWNNAEYEGMLSGKLFNNRLLLNGQFGYRDNANATTSFIGDFELQYLLVPSGNLAIRMYNQTNDRYFTKSSLNTQGIGLIMKKDFSTWRELFRSGKKNAKTDAATTDSIQAPDSIQ